MMQQLVAARSVAIKATRPSTRRSTERALTVPVKAQQSKAERSRVEVVGDAVAAVPRRDALAYLATAMAAAQLACPAAANAKPRGMEAYVKKKQLDSIDTYVPSILLTRAQYVRVGPLVASDIDPEDVAESGRDLLRIGAAASMRENIRAVARYASEEAGEGSAVETKAQVLLTTFIKGIDTIDSTLLVVKRKKKIEPDQVVTIQATLDSVLQAIDELVGLLPSDVVERGRKIADADSLPVPAFVENDESDTPAPTKKLTVDASLF